MNYILNFLAIYIINTLYIFNYKEFLIKNNI